MGETGVLHDGVDADAVEALVAEQPRRRIDDPLAIFRRLFPTDPHESLLVPLTLYMTIDIKKFNR